MSNKDLKVRLSVGCTDYLVEEVERLRKENALLQAQNSVMDNFFNLMNRIGDKPVQGFSPDLLWQAKKEIKEAISKEDLKAQPMERASE